MRQKQVARKMTTTKLQQKKVKAINRAHLAFDKKWRIS